jgi:hypothetical protein
MANEPYSAMQDGTVARLLQRDIPTVPSRIWCVLAGEWKFDGNRIAFDGKPAEHRALRDAAEHSEDGNMLLIWMPRLRRQRGRIPKSLRCGFTVFNDGQHLIAFQSVAFVPRAGKIDLIATTSSGQFVTVPTSDVASWDGSSIDAPTVTIAS